MSFLSWIKKRKSIVCFLFAKHNCPRRLKRTTYHMYVYSTCTKTKQQQKTENKITTTTHTHTHTHARTHARTYARTHAHTHASDLSVIQDSTFYNCVQSLIYAYIFVVAVAFCFCFLLVCLFYAGRHLSVL